VFLFFVIIIVIIIIIKYYPNTHYYKLAIFVPTSDSLRLYIFVFAARCFRPTNELLTCLLTDVRCGVFKCRRTWRDHVEWSAMSVRLRGGCWTFNPTRRISSHLRHERSPVSVQL